MQYLEASNNTRTIFAIDPIFETMTPNTNCQNIRFGVDLCEVLQDKIDFIFMSDVLHHLPNHSEILANICTKNIKYIAIKDIDANYKFGDFMNKAHDFLINKERVCSIFPQNLAQILRNGGYEMKYFYLPKLWYPHFLIIAHAKGEK